MRVGQRFSRSAFAVHLCVTELGYPRLGIAVGRRVSLKANKRNTIKRIIRECFRHHAHALPSIDVVFNARPPALATTRKELANAVIGAMRHAERVATAEVTS
jgi:ribonuclease P protein component